MRHAQILDKLIIGLFCFFTLVGQPVLLISISQVFSSDIASIDKVSALHHGATILYSIITLLLLAYCIFSVALAKRPDISGKSCINAIAIPFATLVQHFKYTQEDYLAVLIALCALSIPSYLIGYTTYTLLSGVMSAGDISPAMYSGFILNLSRIIFVIGVWFFMSAVAIVRSRMSLHRTPRK